LRPGPLGAESVAALARAAVGAQPDPGFVTACRSATGGNPLFLRAVLDMLARERVTPTSANASRVAQTGPAEISRQVSLGLARLPHQATSLIRAAAILGDGHASNSSPSWPAWIWRRRPGPPASSCVPVFCEVRTRLSSSTR